MSEVTDLGAYRRDHPRLSAEQQSARDAILSWVDGDEQSFVLAGYAGTGKTTMLREVFRELGSDRVTCHTPTGKAAAVLQDKLGDDAGPDGVKTLHSLLYTPDPPSPQRVADLKTALEACSDPAVRKQIAESLAHEERRLETNDVRWVDRHEERQVVIVDEASMVSPRVEADLRRCASRVLFVGDPFQLPPVDPRAERAGEELDFFVRNRPDATLTEVHRQAGDSSVLAMATAIRNDQRFTGWDDDCRFTEGCTAADLVRADQVITGKNVSRRMVNSAVRRQLGYVDTLPQSGERLICLRNDWGKHLINGVAGVATSDARPHPDPDQACFKVDLLYEDRVMQGLRIDDHAFRLYQDPRRKRNFAYIGAPKNEFDFGYSVTVHKAQGSEWPHVLVYDDGMQKGKKLFRRRWAYTAVTRASERLTWVKEF